MTTEEIEVVAQKMIAENRALYRRGRPHTPNMGHREARLLFLLGRLPEERRMALLAAPHG